MKKFSIYNNHIILFAASLFVLMCMFVFNEVLMQVRIQELQYFLQQDNSRENDFDLVWLIARYKSQKTMQQKKRFTHNQSKQELKIQLLLSENNDHSRLSNKKLAIIAYPVLAMINSLRYILGKQPIKQYTKIASNGLLEKAYYYESNKYYKKAIAIYDDVIGYHTLNKTTRGRILLHRGFCYSLLGNYKDARADYQTVINNYKDKSISIFAIMLLEYLEGFRKQYIAAIKQRADSLQKGQQLYYSIEFKRALHVFNRIDKSTAKNKRPKLLYYKALCLEELAKKVSAARLYNEIIVSSHKTIYARLSNRRLYVIGSLDQSAKNLKQQAILYNKIIKDKEFDAMLQETNTIKKLKQNKQKSTPYNTPNLNTTFEKSELKKYITRLQKYSGKKPTSNQTPFKGKQKLITNDGNIFIGRITKITADKITIRTSFSYITIKKSKIKILAPVK